MRVTEPTYDRAHALGRQDIFDPCAPDRRTQLALECVEVRVAVYAERLGVVLGAAQAAQAEVQHRAQRDAEPSAGDEATALGWMRRSASMT